MARDYATLLRDPRWQRKRIEILERDGWSCTECGEKDAELQVHHRYYAKDRAPWEYEDGAMVTLCDPCHEHAEQVRLLLIRTAGLLGLDATMRVVGYAEGIAIGAAITSDAKVPFRGPNHLLGIAQAIGADPVAAASCFSADGQASSFALLAKAGGR